MFPTPIQNATPFVRSSYKVLLPGYSDELAYDLGLIDTDLPFAEAQRRFRIDEKAQRLGDGEGFSAAIRQGF